MAEHYSFFDPVETAPGVWDREYNAEEFTDYFGALITTGVMKGAFNMLAVTANGSNMVTSVNTGIAFVEAKRYFNDAPLTFTHDTETIGLSRIDRIVVRMDQNVESRYVRAFVKKGTASTNPVPPALTQNATVYEISLAQVRITGGQTFIASNAVTDERGTDIICPWAGSNILPSFDDNALATHINDDTLHIPYVIAEGTANAYTALIPNVIQYTEGMAMSVKINIQNTGVSTINVNGLGAKNIIKGNGNTVSSGNLKANSIYTLRYNGTAFILQGEGGEGTALVADVLSGKTFTNDSGTFNGTMANNGAGGTVTPSTVNQTKAAGYYSSPITISGSGNLVASNIKSGVNIFGVNGSFTGLFAQFNKTFNISAGVMQQTIPVTNIGFVPKYWLCSAGALQYNNGTRSTSGLIAPRSVPGMSIYGGGAMYLASMTGTWSTATNSYQYSPDMFVQEGSSYVSGQNLYYILDYGETSFSTMRHNAHTGYFTFYIWG